MGQIERVEMNIKWQMKKVGVFGYKYFFISSLKKGAGSFIFLEREVNDNDLASNKMQKCLLVVFSVFGQQY